MKIYKKVISTYIICLISCQQFDESLSRLSLSSTQSKMGSGEKRHGNVRMNGKYRIQYPLIADRLI